MREWLEAQLSAGLPALAGSEIHGTVAVKQELINELLAEWLAGSSDRSGVLPRIDLPTHKNLVKYAHVRAEPGTLLVDFKIAI